MKKYIAAIVAASLIGAPAFAAPGHGSGDRGRVEQQQHKTSAPKKNDSRKDAGRNMNTQKVSWKKGDRFDRRQASNYRVIDNPRSHKLGAAPKGQQWVRSGNDAVLIGITSGVVAAVIANILR